MNSTLKSDSVPPSIRAFIEKSGKIKSPENAYFTGLSVKHPPSGTEEVVHFALYGGDERRLRVHTAAASSESQPVCGNEQW